jgi:hypothetical protein
MTVNLNMLTVTLRPWEPSNISLPFWYESSQRNAAGPTTTNLPITSAVCTNAEYRRILDG